MCNSNSEIKKRIFHAPHQYFKFYEKQKLYYLIKEAPIENKSIIIVKYR